MKTSDLITLLGAVVAAIAIVVSASIALIAVKVQRDQAEFTRRQADTVRQQAQEDAKKDLANVAQALASRVNQLLTQPNATTPETANASAEITGLVIRANELTEAKSGVTWYLHFSLALAYGWLWENDKAAAHYKKALDNAEGQSRITVLRGEAAFRYNTGAIETGRACFSRAEEILREDYSGDPCTQYWTSLLAQRAWQEFWAGERSESASIYAEAWEQSQTIISPWRRTSASMAVSNNYLYTFGQDQTQPPNTIPVGLVAFVEGLRRQQSRQASASWQQDANMQPSISQSPPMLQDGSGQAVSQQLAGPVLRDVTALVPG